MKGLFNDVSYFFRSKDSANLIDLQTVWAKTGLLQKRTSDLPDFDFFRVLFVKLLMTTGQFFAKIADIIASFPIACVF